MLTKGNSTRGFFINLITKHCNFNIDFTDYFGFTFRAAEKTTPKELESKVPQKDIPKEDKH